MYEFTRRAVRLTIVIMSEECFGCWLLLTFLAVRFLSRDDGGDTFLRNVGSYKSHGLTSQKAAFFIVTVVKTSNHT
jgi:hypothetical protein